MDLKEYGLFWRQAGERIAELTGVMALTVDDEMAKRIRGLALGSRILFWLPPTGRGRGRDVDSFREEETCVVFVMEKYDPGRRQGIDVLESTQGAIERVKELILESHRRCIGPIRLGSLEISTMAETRFFAGFAGWSISFTAVSPIGDGDYRHRRKFSDEFGEIFD